MKGEGQKPAVLLSRRGKVLIWSPRGRLSFELTCAFNNEILRIFVPVTRFGTCSLRVVLPDRNLTNEKTSKSRSVVYPDVGIEMHGKT